MNRSPRIDRVVSSLRGAVPLRVPKRLRPMVSARNPGRGSTDGNWDQAAAEDALAGRQRQAAQLLGTAAPERSARDLLVAALDREGDGLERRGWLAWVAYLGYYPTEAEVRALARLLRRSGGEGVAVELESRHRHRVTHCCASLDCLDLLEGVPLIDVTHTLTSDLNTGIQRVTREVGARWIARGGVGVAYDDVAGCVRRLDDAQRHQVRSWADGPDSAPPVPPASHGIAVPWGATLVMPELVVDPARTAAYRGLAIAHVLQTMSLIGYDMVPVVAAETVEPAMPAVFAHYLAMVKHADRLLAISESAAQDFRSFGASLQSQGLRGPHVQALPLPVTPHVTQTTDLDDVANSLGIGGRPVVLVVGSHEPRKNHLVVLEAAGLLWSEGLEFELLFLGGSGWQADDFWAEIERLTREGRPIQVRSRATERELWASYRLARFTVFPSLLEGYGLPIAESLACGTPVITSAYGSMREIGSGGGALLIDPRDPDAVGAAMHSLLTDDSLTRRLADEARTRRWSDWDDYAQAAWNFLVVEPGSDSTLANS